MNESQENKPTEENETAEETEQVTPAEEEIVDPLSEALAQAAAYKEQLMRVSADFDNYRKRAQRDTVEAKRRSREDTVRDLLSVFDNLERALEASKTATEIAPVRDGLTMVMKIFIDTLEKLEITRVNSVGEAFDPNLHEAIQQLESAEHAPGTVMHEIQPGYAFGERLLRPALVVVAKAPAAS